MDNIESILDELNDYDQHKTPEISNRLEEYIGHLAKTGETLFPWLKIRGVLRHKLELVMANFKEICPTENLPPCPNVDPFQFETVRDKILEQFDSFTCAPFTIQRLCELLCAPRKHYKRTDKFMRGIEKNLLVVSTVDPAEQRKRADSSSLQTLVNGVAEVPSHRPIPSTTTTTTTTFGVKNEQRPSSAASDAASSVSDADSGISDTEDEEKIPLRKETIQESVQLQPEESKEPTESVEPPVAMETTPAEEEQTVTSAESVTEETAIQEKEEEIPAADVTSFRSVIETNPSVSDKKRPLDKEDGPEDGAAAGLHSPDAKQPRIFTEDDTADVKPQDVIEETSAASVAAITSVPEETPGIAEESTTDNQ